jgi:hypothetical protein
MENDFENKMKNLETPNTDLVKHQEPLKIGLIGARKSARIGILFIGIPLFLIVIAYVKLSFLIKMNFYSNFQHFISGKDHTFFFKWISPVILIALPIIAVFINLLAITHFYINKPNKELVLTIRYRFKNLIVIIISSIIILSVFWHILLLNKF